MLRMMFVCLLAISLYFLHLLTVFNRILYPVSLLLGVIVLSTISSTLKHSLKLSLIRILNVLHAHGISMCSDCIWK
jgi:hypothetical protein